MIALVLVVLGWTALAASMALVIGHGIRMADEESRLRSGRREAGAAAHELEAAPAS